jgi:predicted O-linked N-acetylglucosamine transferase (SPINDLY family)
MPGDRRRLAAGTLQSRVEAGLPEDGFVFCGFNNIAKINQSVFHTWMQILAAVEGSVLWLTAMDEYAIGNLCKEAARRGVDPTRLVFAERVPTMAQHVARQQLADLFLDTLPYNAHSTAMDALSAGLPVLTQIGESYAARVTASLLTTLGLPELIVTRLDAYEARAIELARNRPALLEIRKKIIAAHRKSALFDTARYTRNLESAYVAMAEQRRFGCEPSDIDLMSWVRI